MGGHTIDGPNICQRYHLFKSELIVASLSLLWECIQLRVVTPDTVEILSSLIGKLSGLSG